MRTILLTGYPGFLGAALLPRLVRRDPGARVACIVQSRFLAAARARLAADLPDAHGRVTLLPGDITHEGLALPAGALDPRDVTEAYHLAAIYDLAVRPEVGERVNVEGTRQVLDWLGACPSLERLHYVSTCYVSGRHPGLFRETQLEHGNAFNNAYERTKYQAEVLVRRRMDGGMPATIYRPSIVVGDSRSGETQKFDGPYFAFQWLLRQGRTAFMPVVGDPGLTRLNLVPRDFIVDAIVALGADAGTVGATFQLADPHALTVAELLEALASALGKRIVRVPLAEGLAAWSLRAVPGVQGLLRIPPATVPYFTHPTHYDTAQATEALRDSGVTVPRLPSYLPVLLDFMRRRPDVGSAAMA
jgi:thioester reductase-like protein